MTNVRLSFLIMNRVTDPKSQLPKTIRVSEWDGMNEYVSRVIWESNKQRCFDSVRIYNFHFHNECKIVNAS